MAERLDDHDRRYSRDRIVSADYQELDINDRRVPQSMRDCPRVTRLMADGFRLFWDSAAGTVRLTKPSDGRIERVAVENPCPPSNTPAAQRNRLVRQRRKAFAQN